MNWFADHPCIWDFYLRDLVKDYPDGYQGHMNQEDTIILPLF